MGHAIYPRQGNACHRPQLNPLAFRVDGNEFRRRKSHGADPRLDEVEAKQRTSDPSYPSAPACARLASRTRTGLSRSRQCDKRRAEGSLGTRPAKCLSALSKQRTRALVKPKGSPLLRWFPVSGFFWCSSFKSPQRHLSFRCSSFLDIVCGPFAGCRPPVLDAK